MPFFFESESNFCMNMSLTALFNGNSKVAPFFLKSNSSEQVWQTLRVPWTASLKFPFDGSLRSRQVLRLQTQAMVFPKESNILLHLAQVLIEQLNESWWSLLQVGTNQGRDRPTQPQPPLSLPPNHLLLRKLSSNLTSFCRRSPPCSRWCWPGVPSPTELPPLPPPCPLQLPLHDS